MCSRFDDDDVSMCRAVLFRCQINLTYACDQ
jgi:hypothetical protein